MQLAVLGTGYVGLVAGACFADSGRSVVCADVDEAKITALRAGEVPLYEPGLEEIVRRNARAGRLSFTAQLQEAVASADVVFLAVGTPSRDDGQPDLRAFDAAVETFRSFHKAGALLVIKSTVPVGTADAVREKLASTGSSVADVVSNPEFLKEGTAVADFTKPERVVIGCLTDAAAATMAELYGTFLRSGNPLVRISNRGAELGKYAANVYLAMRISFINDIATLSERLGTDVFDVKKVLVTDSRIGRQFLYPGIGYGGSCFPKDVAALQNTAKAAGGPAALFLAVSETNERQKRWLTERLLAHFGGSLRGKTIALWGLAFKPETNDVREAPGLAALEQLTREGATVRVFDPAAMEEARRHGAAKAHFAENAYDALSGADALAVATEWSEFRNADFAKMKKLLKTPVIVDGRNMFTAERAHQAGFVYYGVGVGTKGQGKA